jgi:hypothetical protein
MSYHELAEGTLVRFSLEGTLPILKERYVSSQAGTVVLRGFFNQRAFLETLDGQRFRTLGPRRDKEQFDKLAYPVLRLPDKTEEFRLLSPLHLEKGRVPQLRYTTLLENQYYVFKQVSAGQRGYELWDSMEMERLVEVEPGGSLVPNFRVNVPVPALLVLLFPWLASQTIYHQQP